MTLHGIDISHWQTGLDVAATDAQFVIVKVTDGTGYIDPQAVNFAHQIIAAGRLGGGYHFYEGAGTAVAQREADHFVDQMKPVIGRALLALDFEHSTTDVAGAKAFLDRVTERTGVRPLIYMSQSLTNAHDWSAVAKDYALWVARYGSSSYGTTGAWTSPAMWQHTDAHSTAGYSVDGDYFYGTAATWRAFAAGEADPDPTTPDPGDDDMPTETSCGYTATTSAPADGDWHGLKINDDGGSEYTLIGGPALATGTLSVVVQADKAGTEVDVRSVHSDVKAGQESKVAYTGFTQETVTKGGTTQIVYAFTERIHDPAPGWSRKLRFQIKAYGGGRLTIADARARALHWK